MHVRTAGRPLRRADSRNSRRPPLERRRCTGACRRTRAAAPPAQPAALDPVGRRLAHAGDRKDRADTSEWLAEQPDLVPRHRPAPRLRRPDARSRSGAPPATTCGSTIREVAAHHLRVTVVGDSFRVEALDDTRRASAVGDERTRAATLAPSAHPRRALHAAALAPALPGASSCSIRRARASRDYKGSSGSRWISPTATSCRSRRNPKPDTMIILSTRGNQRRALRVGLVRLHGGQARRAGSRRTRLLEPGVGEDDFGVFFRDATTGKETYAAGPLRRRRAAPGRALRARLQQRLQPGVRRTRSTTTARSRRKANTLKVAIRAGEKDSHYH